MGNRSNIPVIEERTLKAKETLKLTKKDIGLFWSVFRRFDTKGEGLISVDNFFVQILGEERQSLFTDAIFELIDVKNQSVIDFGEFVSSVCTYSVFQVSIDSFLYMALPLFINNTVACFFGVYAV
mmetsp:Transcript_10365/g.14500  ORF Transcript_10365/g.14500 Transcript_10365/m.14500 type:complete len:125 (-) Transcript_10365:68-442(-)